MKLTFSFTVVSVSKYYETINKLDYNIHSSNVFSLTPYEPQLNFTISSPGKKSAVTFLSNKSGELIPKYNNSQICVLCRWFKILDKVDWFHVRVLLLPDTALSIPISMILIK